MGEWITLDDVLVALNVSLRNGDVRMREGGCDGVQYVVSEFAIDAPVEAKVEGEQTMVRFLSPIEEGPAPETKVTRLKIALRPVPCIELEETGE